jgi:hypothetical protein
MAVTQIKKKISDAIQHENRWGDFRAKLSPRMTELSLKLEFRNEPALDTVMDFLTDYVRSVPGSLNLVKAFSKQLGFHAYAAPFLHLAEDYFLNPPADIPQEPGLEPLLDEAFLAHRLLEEVNDQHIRHLQRPLLPLDLTEANIIVHHLLGDTLAIRLEHLVEKTAAGIFYKAQMWEKLQSLPGSAIAPDTIITSANFSRSPGSLKLKRAS